MKKFSKTLLIVVLVILLGFAGFLGWLTLTEYNPVPVATLEPITREATAALSPGATVDLLSWNIGYAGLGAESDFIMDGGQHARSADENTVRRYLKGIEALTSSEEFDLVILQEVDTDSARTFSIDQAKKLSFGTSYHALNFSCPFVPNPVTYFYDPIGKVNSGLLTASRYQISGAERISLPCPFSWPLRIANLKRCLLVSYLPIEGSEQKLVLVNLHLEAYDDGEGKIAQTKQLREFIQSEYEKGNYVIAGGDFNQVFPHSLDSYPNNHPELWEPGVLELEMLPADAGWQFVYDLRSPTCRLLNQPYDPEDTVNTQYYVIDGFIISPNVQLELVETLNMGFENSDHNPVHMRVTLR
jgi:endonuclease/exonuclease/phosphatase family metal-dependent hydrolase